MQLTNLHVKNLRSIRDSEEFPLKPLFAMVGENNTGKSNLLRAIDVLLSAGVGKLSREDFNDTSMPIVIKGVFGNLSPSEQKRWRPYLVGDTLSLEKHIALAVDDRTGKVKLEAEFHGYQAEPTLWYLSLQKIQEKHGDRPKWADIAKDNKLPDYFLEDGKSNKTVYSKAVARYLLENDVGFDPPDLSTTHALGLQSNVIASLPRVYLLPAITDYSDEIDKRSSSSTFRRLMAALSERILEKDPRFVDVQKALTTIRGLLNPTATEGAPPRIESLVTIETKIKDLLRKVMPSVTGVSLAVEVDEVKDLFSAGVSLSVNDGVDTNVLAKGHGLQRCVVFTLLQTLILNERNQLMAAGNEAPPSVEPILLLIEEPELYIHPQLAKLFFDVMASFAETDQVIYTTHSPLFVDAYRAENVGVISKPTPAVGTRIRSYDTTAFDGIDNRGLFNGFTRLNPSMNELFFAKRVLLVEGPQDSVAVAATLKALGRITMRPEELEWSVIVCGGKESIPFFQRVLNAFAIPYAVLHDTDITPGISPDNKAKHEKNNNTIRSLARGNKIHSYPVELEHSLGLTAHFSSQYDAHVFFSDSSKITQEVKDIIGAVFVKEPVA
jgi:putative ATP-dependent endonuclease of OLD family